MSTVVAPLPSGFGVSAVAEHRPRRDPEAHHAPDDETKSDDRPPADDQQKHHAAPPEPPPVTEEPVPAETLFAAALFANDMLRQPPSAEEVRLRAGQGWSPPDSPLKLKDKLI